MRTILLWLTSVVLTSALSAHARGQEAVDYQRDIKPLLKERCYACHGALKQKGKLRLDTVALMLKGNKTGPAVVPGNLADSTLVERVSSKDDSVRMPPEGKPLTDAQLAKLKAWITQGAHAPSDEKPEEDPHAHWAFQKPARPVPPQVKDPSWIRNPIDAFIAAEHDRHGIKPLAAADKQVLVRRVYLDLIGLPPTVEELHGALNDESAGWYEKVVDRLLNDPRYGERWGRHWMDVWRYSDWYGRRAVPDVMISYPRIWRWRDWIVRSLNQDKGYDRMIVEMLAADEIAPDDPDTLVATGFLVRNWFKWNYHTWMKDNVEHTGKAFLGLTLNCCHCHDHKYDPISQEEYFKFRAFFEPLELRHDRVAGEADPGPFKKYVYGVSYGPIASGMIRVFDEKLDAKTLMYSGGDTRNLIQGKQPIDPGAPAVLGGDRVRVEPVELPVTAYYPGIQPMVQQDELATREQAVAMARANVEAAKAVLLGAQELQREAAAQILPRRPLSPRIAEARSAAEKTLKTAAPALELAEARLAQAEADLGSVRARIAADNVKYHKAPGNFDELAKAASKAERVAAACAARTSLLVAERALASAAPKAKEKAEQARGTAKKALDTAQAALTAENTTYAPLGPIYPSRTTGRRTALARWLASTDNPLTARVAVNHLWMRHFGKAIVDSTFDFGRNGKRPTHPQLLDWLAVELMDNGWKMKHLHRLVVTSNAYRMRSHTGGPDHANFTVDPDNRWLWRFPPGRMQAETVRDSLLHVAGELDPAIGGQEIDHKLGLTSKRRSLYFAHHGESKMEFLELFDAANPCECYKRSDSVLPQQALALSNSELSLSLSRVLARKMTQQIGERRGVSPTWTGEEAFVTLAFERVLSRAPTAKEKTAAVTFLHKQMELFKSANPAELTAAGTEGPSPEPGLRARENLVHALFNHNDFVTVR